MAYLEYIRKSRADDPTEPIDVTLAKHRQYLEEKVIKPRRLVVAKVYEEVVTGDSLFMRPQMMQMLADMESGEYEGVICMDIDRLGRGGMKDQGIILEALKWSETKIITPDRIYDLNDDVDEEMAEYKTFFSRREYKTITKRLQRGIKQTIQSGGYIANAPYGYTKVTVNKIPTLQINEEEAYYVRMMFDMYVNQGIGCHVIAQTLNAQGAKPHRAAEFGRTSVMHILRNPVFTGKIVWDRKKHVRKGTHGNETHITIYQKPEQWTVVDGMHPPIIDADLFQRAQEIFKCRYHPPANNGTVKNPLSGLVRCAKCGFLLQMQHPYKKDAYLQCLTKGCSAAAKLEYVEDALLDALRRRMEALEFEVANAAPIDLDSIRKAVELIRRSIAKVETQKDQLYNLLEQQIYTVEVFQKRMAVLDQKTAELSMQEAAQIEAIQRANRAREAKMIERIKTVLEGYGVAENAKEKNDVLKSVLDCAQYKKDKKTQPREFEVEIELRELPE